MYFIIHTEDKATKAKVGEHVVYNIEWLKKHFNIERKLYEKKGEWIYEDGNIPYCSICGKYSEDADLEDVHGKVFYCSHCGSRNEGGK